MGGSHTTRSEDPQPGELDLFSGKYVHHKVLRWEFVTEDVSFEYLSFVHSNVGYFKVLYLLLNIWVVDIFYGTYQYFRFIYPDQMSQFVVVT